MTSYDSRHISFIGNGTAQRRVCESMHTHAPGRAGNWTCKSRRYWLSTVKEKKCSFKRINDFHCPNTGGVIEF